MFIWHHWPKKDLLVVTFGLCWLVLLVFMTGLILNEAACSHDSMFPKYPDERYTSPLLFAPHPGLFPPSLCHFLYAPTLFSIIRPSAMCPPAQSCLLSYLNLTLRFISPPHAFPLPHPSRNPFPFSSHPRVYPFIIWRPSFFPFLHLSPPTATNWYKRACIPL